MSDATIGRSGKPSRGNLGDVLRVASGNFLEMYDFMVFGYFAATLLVERSPEPG